MACATKKRVCIGQLDKYIQIESRNIKAPVNANPSDVDADEIFDNRIHLWANIKTSVGEAIFDGANIEQTVTHIITFNYPGFTVSVEDWIIYDNRRFKIMSVENINEDGIFISVRCVDRGIDTKQATKA